VPVHIEAATLMMRWHSPVRRPKAFPDHFQKKTLAMYNILNHSALVFIVSFV
jgi:hypothetical protein